MSRKWVVFFVLLCWGGCISMAGAAELGVITGSAKGTYFQFGLNMMELGQSYGYTVSVYNSKGSVENVYAVYKRPKTQMGIVQSDVLAFVLKVKSNKTLKRIARKTKMVFPLYNEEIHLVGRQDILSFDDLEGKRVAIGKEGSGTYLTSRLLFEISGVEPGETLAVGTDEALEMLKNNRVDAMFYVAGVPVKLFSESVTPADNLHLVPITNKSIAEFYPMTGIPAGTYNWQPEEVSTAAVKAVLVSFDFRRNNCDHVGRFAATVYEHLDWLKENGHPKWRQVDLDYPLKGWDQYDCVKKFLNKSVSAPASPMDENPLMDAIKEVL